MRRLLVQFHIDQRIGARPRRSKAHPPGLAAVEEGRHLHRAAIRLAQRDLDIDLLIVERIAGQARQFERRLDSRIGAALQSVDRAAVAILLAGPIPSGQRAAVAVADVAAQTARQTAIVLRSAPAACQHRHRQHRPTHKPTVRKSSSSPQLPLHIPRTRTFLISRQLFRRASRQFLLSAGPLRRRRQAQASLFRLLPCSQKQRSDGAS